LLASAVGNDITKFPPLDCLSSPKSITAIAGFPVALLYIKAPLAVREEELQVVSEKSKKAVVPESAGLAAILRVLPPAVYPVPDTSLVVLYAVVPACKVAEEVYNAILKACEVLLLKSISPSKRAVLNDEHIACVIDI
tara:strand:- start:208 stop:621 length:414 start_codon:yes stop_codon:yes gene_type:complete